MLWWTSLWSQMKSAITASGRWNTSGSILRTFMVSIQYVVFKVQWFIIRFAVWTVYVYCRNVIWLHEIVHLTFKLLIKIVILGWYLVYRALMFYQQHAWIYNFGFHLIQEYINAWFTTNLSTKLLNFIIIDDCEITKYFKEQHYTLIIWNLYPTSRVVFTSKATTE